MSQYRKDNGYGLQQFLNIKELGSGKVFVVGDSGIANRAMLQELFNGDPDGESTRFFATIDAAINACTANAGDNILVMPGHAETITAAGGIALDVDGVSIIGIGVGEDRPKLTFSTATTASMTIPGDGVAVKNIIGLAAIDALANPFNVTGDGVEMDIEWRDQSSTVEAARAILINGSDNSNLKLKYNGFTAGNAVVNAIRVVNCTNLEIDINAYGVNTTGWVEFLTTASTNVNVRGYFYTDSVTDFSQNVVDTVTGSTWTVQGFDGGAGVAFSGGSGSAVASQDAAAITSAVTAVGTAIAGTTGVTDSYLGTFVSRAPADIFDGTTTSLFTVGTDNIILTHFEMIVSGAAVDATNCNVKIQANPTTGTTVDLCANLDVISDELGTIYTLTGTLSDALQGGAAGASAGMAKPIVIAPGTIDLVASADAGTGGALVEVRIWYRVASPNATVVVA